jgi:ribosomal protein S19E (S16A)
MVRSEPRKPTNTDHRSALKAQRNRWRSVPKAVKIPKTSAHQDELPTALIEVRANQARRAIAAQKPALLKRLRYKYGERYRDRRLNTIDE